MGEEKRHQLSRGADRRDEGGEENRDRRRRDRHGDGRGYEDEGRYKEERKAETRTGPGNAEPRRETRRTSQSVEIGRDKPPSRVGNGGSRSSTPVPNHDSRDSIRRVEIPPTTTIDNSSLSTKRRDHSSSRGASGSDRKSITYPPHPSRDRDPSQKRGRGSNTYVPKDKPTQSRGENITIPLPSRSNRSQDPRPGRRDPSINRGLEKLQLDDLRGSKAAATDDLQKRSGDGPASKVPTSLPRDKVKVGFLPKCYQPRKEEETRRLIVFGDVHGMPDAKNCLLEYIKYNRALDHQIFGGDMITKGRKSMPSKNATTKGLITIEASKDVVRQARRDGASGVRGNHEDCVLNVKHERNGWQESIDREMDNQFDIHARKKLRTPDHRDTSDYDLCDALTTEERRWLEDLPDILVLGKCGGRNNMVVVHAGLNPFFDLQHQRVIETMNIKSIDPVKGYTSSMHVGDKERKALDKKDQGCFSKMIPWFEAWEDKQKSLPPNERMTVMYGHESKKGLTKRKFSIGLDTGAQRIDKLNPDKYRTLTALIIHHDRCEIVQVKEIKKETGEWKWEPVELTKEESDFSR
ncbi:putative ser thr protein phosphatase family protein [Botrytis fragariae]|uniref:Putative ser thr protein phosphatase family protein n=1 Tax=Botrytis fragariae TaxID=1964551 RepID=A0A8H6AV88_9HELO|nr:putative ser thr protein phosphatase family protein [Botrytis fragariae]KAF5874213.1 putative ser thr protein phosphatase family protein [Botrytis fragariae]